MLASLLSLGRVAAYCLAEAGHDRVRVLQSGRNGGYGAGNNVGIRAGLRRAEPLAGLVALSTYLPLGTEALARLIRGLTV